MFDKVMAETARAAEERARENASEEDYMQDGLLYCGRCRTQKQCRVTFFGEEHVVYCTCECRQQELAEEEKAERRRVRQEWIEKRRIEGIPDANLRTWTFEKDDSQDSKAMRIVRRYYEKWEKVYADNIGLYIYGNVGTGKTFAAACIANGLIDKGVPVLMTSFSRLVNALTGFKEADKNAYIASLHRYKLLVIDDLGVERQSDFAMEQIYNIIDSRYKDGQPIIVTTNRSVEELCKQADTKNRRIFDRILEMTVPVKIDGVSRREQLHREKLERARETLLAGSY